MPFTHMIVWIFFIGAIIFLYLFTTKRMRQIKKEKRKAALIYQEKKEKYTYLKEGSLDECPREDVSAAVLFHCMRKEEEDFDNYFDNMNESERIIYGIYLISNSLDSAHASLHSFFLSPAYEKFVPICAEIFEKVGAYDIYDLMRAARRFAEIIEKDLEDDENDPEMGDYARYNFSDFTNEYLTLISTTNLNEKLTDFVLEHKDDFYDYDIPEEYLESGDDDEGISE